MLDHAVGVLVLPGDAAQLGLDVGAKVHAGAVPPDEPGLAGLLLPLDKVDGGGDGLVVHRFHALPGQWTGVLDLLLAVGQRPGMNHAARTELLAEFGVLRVVLVFRLLLGVQVVEVAEELVEAVVGGQELILVAQVVLAELARGIAERLEEGGDRWVFRAQAEVGARQADLGKARAEHALPRNERGAPGRAGLFAVVVGEDHTLAGDAIDVRGLVPHQAVGIGADVRLADVVAPDDEDIRLAVRGLSAREKKDEQQCRHHSHIGFEKLHGIPLSPKLCHVVSC